MMRSPFLPLVKKFFEYDPAAAAHTLETMEEAEALRILKGMPPSLSAQERPRSAHSSELRMRTSPWEMVLQPSARTSFEIAC